VQKTSGVLQKGIRGSFLEGKKSFKKVLPNQCRLGILIPDSKNTHTHTTTMKLIRQTLNKTDIHPRYKTEDEVYEIIPRYSGHSYNKPTFYSLWKNGKSTRESFDTLKEVRDALSE
jgi:hypothetical protein